MRKSNNSQGSSQRDIENSITKPTTELVNENLIEKMNKQSTIVKVANDSLMEYYSCSIKPTIVSEIINGESIVAAPENIMISSDIPDDIDIDIDELTKWLSTRCTKKLYNYQLESLITLRRLELQGSEHCEAIDKTVNSNGWLLSLPIGSGKSLVFMALALYFRTVPANPIIMSVDGKSLPEHEQILWKDHPYYYETCGYIDGERNAVIACKNYKQRKQTIILTHMHLISQMESYFHADFPGYEKYVNIAYVQSLHDIKKFENIDILVIPATQDTINGLVKLSYDIPFTRVIVDDYTSMPSVDRFRQILASSTIFVSGSGFNRKTDDIPSSYYTLKYAPTSLISLVGDPNKTYAGVFRDCISTTELMGTVCKFSIYKFVTDCEDTCRGMLSRMDPERVYPSIDAVPQLRNYLALGFILNNFTSIKDGIRKIENGLTTPNPKTGKMLIDPSTLEYYLEWKKEIADVSRNPPRRNIKTKQLESPSLNPLYISLYNTDIQHSKFGQSSSNISKPLDANPECLSCKRRVHEHDGFGMLSRCCGAFYCDQCLNNMCTHRIIDSASGMEKYDRDNYYCLSCRRQNPTYICNTTRKKDSHQITSINLIEEYFDTSKLTGHNKFDYYFYMFKHGFVPLNKNGPPINVALDIQMNMLTLKDLESNNFIINQIYPTDQLAVAAIDAINSTLAKLNIFPVQRPVIIYYGCPDYMEPRVKTQFDDIIADNIDETSVTIKLKGGRTEKVQPIKGVTLKFVRNMSELIGLHENVIGIVAWETPENLDDTRQLIGRVLRLSSWTNKIYFYISTSSTRYA